MNKEYRHGLVNAQIEVDLPLQIRALRRQLVGTQPELSAMTGMKQPRISAMEKPGGAHFTLETLRRLAEAFDVALIVRFAPFSELLDWSGRFNPDSFRVPNFAAEAEAPSKIPARKERAFFLDASDDLSWLGNSREVERQAVAFQVTPGGVDYSEETSRNQLGIPASTIPVTGPPEVADSTLAQYRSEKSPAPIDIEKWKNNQRRHRRSLPRVPGRRASHAGR